MTVRFVVCAPQFKKLVLVRLTTTTRCPAYQVRVYSTSCQLGTQSEQVLVLTSPRFQALNSY
jgi:hypothetical protein